MASVQIAVSDTSLVAGETCLLSFTFSDNVNDFSLSDIWLAGSSGSGSGTLSGFNIIDLMHYEAIFTPTEDFEGDVVFEVPFASYSVSGMELGEGGLSVPVSIDTKAPVASIFISDVNLDFRETTTVTVVFSEPVTGFDWTDLQGPTGSFFDTTVSADGLTYTASYYPGDGWNYTAVPATLLLAGGSFSDMAGNPGMEAESNAFFVDTLDENVIVFALQDTLLTQGESLLINVSFVTPVGTFNPGDVVWPDDVAVMSPWTYQYEDSGPNAGMISGVFAYLTPYADVTSSDNRVLVRGVSSGIFSIDTLAPVITSINFSDSHLSYGETTVITVNFSEPVSGFELSDIDLSAASGGLSNFIQVDSATFQMTFTPDQDVVDSSRVISIINGSYTDLPGNVGAGATSASFTISTVPPDTVAPAPIVLLSSTLVGSAGVEITVQFDEPVQNFTADDVAVMGAPGVLTGFVADESGLLYQMTFVPLPDMFGQENQVVVLPGGYTDVAGNEGLSGVSAIFTIDSERPFGISLPLNDSMISAEEFLIATLVFSEPVTGLDVSDFDISQAAVQSVSLTDQGDGVYTVTAMPIAGRVQTMNQIFIADGRYFDQAGNPGFSIVLPDFTIDTMAPVANLTVSDQAVIMGESLVFTITFDEQVTGFDITDIYLDPGIGTLGELVFDGVLSYSVEVTPAAGLTAFDNVISVNGGYTDLAGNAGENQVSDLFDIDTVAPILSIGLSDTELTLGESVVLTFTFSERVSNFSEDDILLNELPVSLTDFYADAGGTLFTAVYTPPDNMFNSSSAFSVAAGSYTDWQGNAGTGASSESFSIDTTPPTIFGTDGNDTLVGGDADDQLCGVPELSTVLGKGSIDQLTGGGGADQFFLGDQRGVFYNDGNSRSSGVKDYAWITDFNSGIDVLIVADDAYIFTSLKMGKTRGTGIYLDTNASDSWDGKDELIAFIVGVPPGSLSEADLVRV